MNTATKDAPHAATPLTQPRITQGLPTRWSGTGPVGGPLGGLSGWSEKFGKCTDVPNEMELCAALNIPHAGVGVKGKPSVRKHCLSDAVTTRPSD